MYTVTRTSHSEKIHADYLMYFKKCLQVFKIADRIFSKFDIHDLMDISQGRFCQAIISHCWQAMFG